MKPMNSCGSYPSNSGSLVISESRLQLGGSRMKLMQFGLRVKKTAIHGRRMGQRSRLLVG
jgi:hypothetical protein